MDRVATQQIKLPRSHPTCLWMPAGRRYSQLLWTVCSGDSLNEEFPANIQTNFPSFCLKPFSLVLQSSKHPGGLPLKMLKQLYIFLVLGLHLWMQYLTWTCKGRLEGYSSLSHSITTPLLMQHKVLLAFWSVSIQLQSWIKLLIH